MIVEVPILFGNIREDLSNKESTEWIKQNMKKKKNVYKNVSFKEVLS